MCASTGIVDPEAELVKVYRRAGAGFPQVAALSRAAGDVLTTPVLPGLLLPLDALLWS